MKEYFSIVAVIIIVAFTAFCMKTVGNFTKSPEANLAQINVAQVNSAQVLQTSQIPATASKILKGWAWSSNIGWIKLDGVKISDNGDLLGYAWSSNIGWVKFGGLSDYPKGGSSATSAKIDTKTGNVTGWSRACAGTVSGDCSVMTSRTDGWDGWIELSGTNHPTNANGNSGSAGVNNKSGVRLDPSTGHISGMAWGSAVVGWLSFDANIDVGSNIVPPCNGGPVNADGSCGGGSVPPPGGNPSNPLDNINLQAVTLSIGSSGAVASANNYSIRLGETFGLKWKNTHDASYVCNASLVSPGPNHFSEWASKSGNVASGADSNITYGGSDTSSAALGIYTFKISCTSGNILDEAKVTLKISKKGTEGEF